MDQLFTQFGIQPHLLIAQIINFGIIVTVLYLVAYKPILRILDQRRDRIEKSLEQAKGIEERTQKLEAEIEKRLHEGREQATQIIAEAKDVGENARNEILVKTSKEISDLTLRAKEEIAREKEKMMEEIKDYIVRTSFLIVDKIVSEKLDDKTKEMMIDAAFHELQPK